MLSWIRFQSRSKNPGVISKVAIVITAAMVPIRRLLTGPGTCVGSSPVKLEGQPDSVQSAPAPLVGAVFCAVRKTSQDPASKSTGLGFKRVWDPELRVWGLGLGPFGCNMKSEGPLLYGHLQLWD